MECDYSQISLVSVHRQKLLENLGKKEQIVQWDSGVGDNSPLFALL
jgi:hypothetical protein